jgi:trk system potassium uptake protein TrkA
VKKFAIIGLGLFGQSLVRSLVKEGAEVIAMDSDMEKVEDVKDEVSYAVKADAADEKSLKSVGLGKVDVVVVAIEKNFEACQLAVIFAKRIGVKRVIARAVSDLHSRILKLVGADEVINPELDYGRRLGSRLVRMHVMDYIELAKDYSLVEMETPAPFVGKSLVELDLRKKYGVNLVFIKRGGKDHEEKMLPVSQPEETIEKGDVLFLAGRDGDLEKVTSLA